MAYFIQISYQNSILKILKKSKVFGEAPSEREVQGKLIHTLNFFRIILNRKKTIPLTIKLYKKEGSKSKRIGNSTKILLPQKRNLLKLKKNIAQQLLNKLQEYIDIFEN